MDRHNPGEGKSSEGMSLPPSLVAYPWRAYIDFPSRADAGGRKRNRQSLNGTQKRLGRQRTQRASPTAARIESLDLFRGLAILAVLFIHVSGHFLKLIPKASPTWNNLAVSHQALQFAVPGFLLLSAFLNGRHLLQGYTIWRYVQSRLSRALWPYLLWSGIGMVLLQRFHIQVVKPSDIVPMLLWGQGFYHLYFLVVLLQLFVLLPLLVLPFRGRPAFLPVITGAIVLQLGFYVINRYYYQVQNVGSLLSWYVVPIVLGLWLASHGQRLNEILKRGLPVALVVAVVSFAVYSPLSSREMLGLDTNTFLYQVAEWSYTASASFLLLAATRMLPLGRVMAPLKACGMFSLQIYLIHPFVIKVIDGYCWPVGRSHLVLGMIGYFAASLLVPYLIAIAATNARVSRFFFGS